MKTLFAALLVLFVGHASANPMITANNPLGLKTVDNQSLAALKLNQPAVIQVARANPPRGLCAKALYYCDRGYQNWCEIFEINNCDNL